MSVKYPNPIRSKAAAVAVCVAVMLGCEDKASPEQLAPPSSALPAAAPAANARKFVVEAASSKLDFEMDAPLEKILGEAPGSVEGELFVDPKDVTKTTGLVKIDLFDLSLYQRKRGDEQSEYGEKKKNENQNAHMRTWFEISDDAPPDVREKNRYAEFRIIKIDNPSQTDVTTLAGPQRKITATVTGDLRLHQRKSTKTAQVEVTFGFDGDKPQSVTIKTVSPLVVGLEEHDVRPREAFGKLAQKTLAAFGDKVATAAPVTLEFTAKAQ
jgi:hypothetical protein